MDGRILDYNHLYCEMLGYSSEEIKTLTYQSITPERWHEYEEVILREQIVLRGYSDVYEKEYRRKDGTIFPVELRTILERDSAGTPIGMWGIVRDITERKAAETALRQSEERFRLFMENSPTISWVKDEAGRYVYISPAYERNFDTTLSIWQGKTDEELFSPETAAQFRENDQTALASGQAMSVIETTLNPDGKPRYWLNTKFLFCDAANRRFVAGIGLDITESKQAEKQLFTLNQRLESLLRALPVGVTFSEDATCQRIIGNPVALMQFEAGHEDNMSASAPSAEDRGRQVRYFCDGQLLADTDLPLQQAVLRNREISPVEIEVHLPSGRRWNASVMAAPIRDQEGKVIGGIAVTVDITDRKRAEEALRESEQRLRLATSVAKIGAFDWDIQKGVNLWTVEEEALHGLAPGEFGRTQSSWEQLIHQADRPHALAAVEKALATGEPVEHDYRVVWPNGSLHWLTGRLQCFKDAAGNPVLLTGVNIDITERKLVEEALQKSKADLEATVAERTAELSTAYERLELQANKLRELAGELTTAELRERKRLGKVLHDGLQQHLVAARLQVGGLAHPLNNPENYEMAKHIEKILEDALNVSRTLAAELSPPVLHDSGLSAGLQWLSRWMSDRHGLPIEVQIEQKDTPRLSEDVKALLFEAVRELLLNVVKHAKANTARIHMTSEDWNIRISVIDDGVGFDTCALFDPKNLSKAFGLFSIRERIILAGGDLQCKSSPGKGATFTLTAPLDEVPVDTEAAYKPCRKADRLLPNPSEGKIRILLADDHAVMREGLNRILAQESEFEVIDQASDGKQAVEKTASLLPDVVLMDISMPVMDGINATRIIHQQHPGIAIIGLSLYTAEERAKEMLDAGASFYLSKTGPGTDLKAAIRACMKEKATEKLVLYPASKRTRD